MGGAVIHWGTWRVNGQLAVSRAIGKFFKIIKKNTFFPEIIGYEKYRKKSDTHDCKQNLKKRKETYRIEIVRLKTIELSPI